jgi:flagellar hook-basal body complex protein FliE
MQIDPIKIKSLGVQPLEISAKQLRPAQPHTPVEKSFRDVLAEAVTEVNRLQTEADTTIKKLASGEITDVAETMLAVEKADVSFQTMMTVRNKVMSAYDEIMRMQV